jgi:hypothetical protein
MGRGRIALGDARRRPKQFGGGVAELPRPYPLTPPRAPEREVEPLIGILMRLQAPKAPVGSLRVGKDTIEIGEAICFVGSRTDGDRMAIPHRLTTFTRCFTARGRQLRAPRFWLAADHL